MNIELQIKQYQSIREQFFMLPKRTRAQILAHFSNGSLRLTSDMNDLAQMRLFYKLIKNPIHTDAIKKKVWSLFNSQEFGK